MNEIFDDDELREGEVEELSLDSLRAAFAEFEPETDTEGVFAPKKGSKKKPKNAETIETAETTDLDEFPAERSSFERGFARLAEFGEDRSDDFEGEYDDSGDSEPENEDENESDAADDAESEDEDEFFDEDSLDPEGMSIEEGEERIETSPATILEALLFVGDRKNEPLSAEKAAGLMRNVTSEEIIEAAAELNRQYRANGIPCYIIRENDSFRMILHPDFEVMRGGFYGKTREARLSQAAIDVLAIVAYRQPITAESIQNIRKSPVGGILGQLVRRELLQVERQTEGKRTTVFYKTTERFLQLFGLESINDMPMAEEMDFR